MTCFATPANITKRHDAPWPGALVAASASQRDTGDLTQVEAQKAGGSPGGLCGRLAVRDVRAALAGRHLGLLFLCRGGCHTRASPAPPWLCALVEGRARGQALHAHMRCVGRIASALGRPCQWSVFWRGARRYRARMRASALPGRPEPAKDRILESRLASLHKQSTAQYQPGTT